MHGQMCDVKDWQRMSLHVKVKKVQEKMKKVNNGEEKKTLKCKVGDETGAAIVNVKVEEAY